MAEIDSREIEELIESILLEKVEPIILERNVAEERKRYRQLTLFAAFFSVIGFGMFGTLANYLIEKAVDYRIEQTAGNIADSIDFSKFHTISLKLDLGQSFTDDELKVVMNYLRRTQPKIDITTSEEFQTALNQVIKSLVSADQSASIDEIFELYGKKILSSKSTVNILLQHYGQEIVGDEHIGSDHLGLENFKILERVAPSADYLETALAYRVLFESSRSKLNTKNYLRRTRALSESNRSIFLNMLFQLSKSDNWVVRATPQSIKIEEVVRSFFTEHGNTLLDTYGLGGDEELTSLLKEIGVDGLEDETTEMVAQHISGLCTTCSN